MNLPIHLFCALFLGLLTLAGSVFASPEPLLLWPRGAPGKSDDAGVEHDLGGEFKDGRPVIRLTNISVPSITLYRAAPEKDTGSTVLVCPGGGYNILAMNLEGTEICDWLNSIGVNAVLLKYRVPAQQPYLAPLEDVQRALGVVREHAAEWKLDSNRIGIIGFSAGGHLAAEASTRFEQRTYPEVDAADKLSCRPDFAMLIYPAYLVKEHQTELAPEIPVTSKTPPTFLFQTQEDPVHVECSLYYYRALKQARVPAEMHLIPGAGHGYGIRGHDPAGKAWPKLAEGWLRGQGMLAVAKK